MKKLTLNAPAKINIGLNIISKREDGFHNLETFFYPIIGLHDKLIFNKCSNFIFDSNNTELVKDPYNLIIKAHTLLQNTVRKKLPISIYLEKKIPIGAGLGGGSSDAAATLVGINEFYKLGIKTEILCDLALQLGSDVPFFIKSKPAVGYSRGEILKQTLTDIDNPILIVNPGIHISTKDAFKNITPKHSSFNYEYFSLTENLDFQFLTQNINNDFEDYVFRKYPAIKDIKSTLINTGALFSIMSGTGSTVYGIFPDIDSANIAKSKLPPYYFSTIVS